METIDGEKKEECVCLFVCVCCFKFILICILIDLFLDASSFVLFMNFSVFSTQYFVIFVNESYFELKIRIMIYMGKKFVCLFVCWLVTLQETLNNI